MAEAVALVGLIAACLQLSDGFLNLSKWIKATARGMKYKPQHISELQANTDLFTICLRKLIRAVKKAYINEPKSVEARETAKAMKIIRKQGWMLESKIYDVVSKAEGGNSSALLRVMAKLQVMFKPKGAQSLQDALSRLMHTIDMLSSGVTLDFLLAKIKVLETSQQAVPEDLLEEVELLKQEIIVHKNVAKDLEARLALQIQESSSEDSLTRDMQEMLSTSRKLDQIVQETVSRYAPELVTPPPTRTRKPKKGPPIGSGARRGSGFSSDRTVPPRSKPPSSPSGVAVVIEGEPTCYIREAPPPTRSRDEIIVIEDEPTHQGREGVPAPRARSFVSETPMKFQLPKDFHRAVDHAAQRREEEVGKAESDNHDAIAKGEIYREDDDALRVPTDVESLVERVHEQWRSQSDGPRVEEKNSDEVDLDHDARYWDEVSKRYVIVENDAGCRYKIHHNPTEAEKRSSSSRNEAKEQSIPRMNLSVKSAKVDASEKPKTGELAYGRRKKPYGDSASSGLHDTRGEQSHGQRHPKHERVRSGSPV